MNTAGSAPSTPTSGSKVTTMSDAIASTRATLNLGEVADILQVHRRSVSRGIEDGMIPSIRLGRRVLVPRLPFLAMLGAAEDGVGAVA